MVAVHLFYFFLTHTVSFSPDVCRSMVAMLDTDQSGKLGLLEIKQLLHNIFKWNAVFRTHDTDKSGHLSAAELRTALNAAGFKLNNRLLTALCHRYGGRDGTITFVDFITCAVKIKTMLGEFRRGWGEVGGSPKVRIFIYVIENLSRYFQKSRC